MSQSERKPLNSMDLMSLGVLGLGCLLVAFFAFTGHQPVSDTQKALWRAESLALQIKQLQADNFKSSRFRSPVERGIASVNSSLEDDSSSLPLRIFKSSGEIGQDPWGRAYTYQTFDHDNGTYLLVLSLGRDGRKETKVMEILVAAAENRPKSFEGDDLGYILPLEN